MDGQKARAILEHLDMAGQYMSFGFIDIRMKYGTQHLITDEGYVGPLPDGFRTPAIISNYEFMNGALWLEIEGDHRQYVECIPLESIKSIGVVMNTGSIE